MSAGRPTLYKPEYCKLIVEFFDQPLYIIKKKEVASGGRKVIIEEEHPNSMPTFERFAINLGVHHETLIEWSRKNPEFSEAYKICKDIQKTFCVEHGLKGGYSPAFTKFLAVNVTDLRDRITHEVGEVNLEFKSQD